jgi:hypothetical protein
MFSSSHFGLKGEYSAKRPICITRNSGKCHQGVLLVVELFRRFSVLVSIF